MGVLSRPTARRQAVDDGRRVGQSRISIPKVLQTGRVRLPGSEPSPPALRTTSRRMEMAELQDVFQRVSGAAGIATKLHIVDSTEKRAWTDGEVVFITTTLVEALSREKVGAILAHELAHILRADVKKYKTVSKGLKAGLDEQLPDGGPSRVLVKATYFVLRQIGLSDFSRMQEYAADRLGQRIAERAGFGNTTLGEALEELAGEHVEQEIFDTHPTTPARVLALEPNPSRKLRIKIFRKV